MDYISTNIKPPVQPSSDNGHHNQDSNLLAGGGQSDPGGESIFGTLQVSAGATPGTVSGQLLGGSGGGDVGKTVEQGPSASSSGFGFISPASSGNSQGVSSPAVTNAAPTLLPVVPPSTPITTPTPAVPINQSLLSGLNFGMSPAMGLNVGMTALPPTAIYYGGAGVSPLGLALPYGHPGLVGLGGYGLAGAPILVAAPSMLSTSGGGSGAGAGAGGGAFSFVGDAQPNSAAGGSGDGDPFSFVKIQ